ncbi:MAG: hypothetical protein PHE86_04985 [Candidatus Marinimicrobia bacterium]|nr:hypothetical protein [Candidatus Neomarinimicrobiota bacterium]
MKYGIYINQVGVTDNGLVDKTDMVDWAIIDYLYHWYFAENSKVIIQKNVRYVWVNYNHLMKEMPMLRIKDKDAISARFKKLKKLGLIETWQAKDNTLYFSITSKCSNIIGFRQEAIPESKKDNLSDSNGTGYPIEIGQGYPIQIGQGYPIEIGQHNQYINNQNINNHSSMHTHKKLDNQKKKTNSTKTKEEIPSLEQVKEYCKERKNNVDPEKWFDFYQAKGWMIGRNKMKDWRAAVRTWERMEQQSTKYSQVDEADEIIKKIKRGEI